MNTKHLAIAAAVAACTAAWAEGPIVADAGLAPSLSRAEVMADYAQFKKAGGNPWSASYDYRRTFKSDLSRADVRRDWRSARDEAHALAAEDSGSDYLARSYRGPMQFTRMGAPAQ
ncbi:DUF4148 domain-containing protein [Ramlibacter rhizophilus]|uniref:DUF4148 domain-containing protein n=1 Tax=Ramlibacter rhizophilus TaxID=1781167 RepID=A0A4Z0BGQ6_9BURK|nr:DUF4148 domain-containing protein [Ramlibacter rhizophilus]TFY98496.1 DUF4148 domain-containing protein [Ramlibacter rhizophilus]